MTASRWARIATWLVAGTMAYNLAEAVIAVWSGVVARSIALVGFGLDSVIELAAGAVVLWRLVAGGREAAEKREGVVLRFVGGTFLLLAIYVTVQAVWVIYRREAPEESVVGIALAIASLVVMPLVAWGKLTAARKLGSRALAAEARETLACSYLSLALLVGLVLNAAAGWWWADPAAALLMVPWLVKEGIEGVRGGDDDDED